MITEGSVSPTSADILKELEGSYMFNRRVAFGPLCVFSLIQLPTTHVTVLEDGIIEIEDIFSNKKSQRFIETDTPFHFLSETTEEEVMFLKNDDRITFVHSQFPQVVFEPTGWSDGRWAITLSAVVMLLASLLVILIFPVKRLYRWRKKVKDHYRNIRVLLFFQAFSIVLSMGLLIEALKLMVYDVSTLSIILLSTPFIPLIMTLVLGMIGIKKTIPVNLKSWYILLSGNVILLIALWIWWDLTPFHL